MNAVPILLNVLGLVNADSKMKQIQESDFNLFYQADEISIDVDVEKNLCYIDATYYGDDEYDWQDYSFVIKVIPEYKDGTFNPIVNNVPENIINYLNSKYQLLSKIFQEYNK